MKVCAVISEFDPFHNGHLVPLAEAIKQGYTHTVAIMSGNWTQRGEPAMFSKYARAEAAVRCGFDLVLELPAPYAISSSERFAFGGVSLAASLGCVEGLCFGSETADLELICHTAQMMDKPNVKRRIDELTKLGESYPAARQKALEVFSPESIRLVSAPNDILGIDYIRAIKKLGSSIVPIAAKRRGVSHDSSKPSAHFASATYLREIIRNGGFMESYMPEDSITVFRRELADGHVSGGMDSLSSAVFTKIRLMNKQDLSDYPDCSSGLGDRIWNAAANAGSIDDLYALAKSKNFTMSRVKRAVAAIMLGIKSGTNLIPVPYAHILAIGKHGDDILKAISSSSDLHISDSTRRLADINAECARFAEIETRASELQAISMITIPPIGSESNNRLLHL
ncbi:MAG: nucleotidyltransferase family protein [Oscillospiraceae bacterium]|nr:nucleotidyltransferase family protein [Oscillospiraceae bacterium]